MIDQRKDVNTTIVTSFDNSSISLISLLSFANTNSVSLYRSMDIEHKIDHAFGDCRKKRKSPLKIFLDLVRVRVPHHSRFVDYLQFLTITKLSKLSLYFIILQTAEWMKEAVQLFPLSVTPQNRFQSDSKPTVSGKFGVMSFLVDTKYQVHYLLSV